MKLTLSMKAGQKYLVEADLWFWEPAADGSAALRWAKETGSGTSGPTLKKNSWVRAVVVGRGSTSVTRCAKSPVHGDRNR